MLMKIIENIKKRVDSLVSNKNKIDVKNPWMWIAITLAGVLLFTQLFEVRVDIQPRGAQNDVGQSKSSDNPYTETAVLPTNGVVLPASWGSLGKQMVESGVIDAKAFESVYAKRGGLTKEEQALVYGDNNGKLKIDAKNAGTILNLLWAFGLSNKNPILENGPMQDPKYGGAGRFASTGGWSLASGNVMNHYSQHSFVTLTAKQQALVEDVSKNIYRPCCNNPTSFPDCNHGMAMLGLLELMASQGASETEMYSAALQANSYWFPSTYLTIAKYFGGRGVSWDEIDPKEILGSAYSSASGYRQILEQVEPPKQGGGSSCGV